jgi:alpha-amylase
MTVLSPLPFSADNPQVFILSYLSAVKDGQVSKISFALVIHSHQPVGNFDHVIEEAYQKAYAPFVKALLLHPQIRLSLHYSGILLEWFEQHHPEYFQQLRQLTERGQVELLGGGYYEPILPAILDADKLAQLRKLSNYLRRHFGTAPRGAWIAERVWEPGLVWPLAEAGVEYVILDDTHFLAAGLDPSELHGIYITEEFGAPLHLVPSLKALRYTIPFREPEETLRVLREGIEHPGSLFAMGDDCEKFGVWPGTHDHVYKGGWLERFLKAVEDAQEWVETATVSAYLGSHAPLGRIYLPTASYPEMMEWALPPGASAELKKCLEETEWMSSGETFRRFLHGGFWRNFLSKYPESNQTQKLMLAVSKHWQKVNGGQRSPAPSEPGRRPAPSGTGWSNPEFTRLLEEAQTHLLASQCNDAYWHGVFGGLYAPHLRSAVLRHLIQAEALLDQVSAGAASLQQVRQEDFDADGQEEILIEQPPFGMIVRPADGGTVSSLRFKPADVELVNSLQRRPEAYHALVRQRVASKEAPREGPASIHDMVLSKEANLEALLRYDRYARHTFRTYVFPAGKQWKDFEYLGLEENTGLAKGAWKAVPIPQGKTGDSLVKLENQARLRLKDCEMRVQAQKLLTSRFSGSAWQIECCSTISTDQACPTGLALGLELVFNLLAPDAPDRYIVANQVRRPLEFRGEIEAPKLLLVDEWQRVKILLDARPSVDGWWIVPIETVSQSESGFERVYQGSAILAVWRIEPPAWRTLTCTLRVEVAPWSPAAGPENSAA